MGYTARGKRLVLVILSAMLLLFLFTSSACVCIVDPANYYYVDNRTDQTLDFFVEGSGFPLVDAPPGEITEFVTIAIPKDMYPADKMFLIEAKTKQGKVVYSEEFTWQELDDMDWTIVIPPLTGSGSLYWIEVQGRFSTNDLAKAQAEIPFNIVLPTYIPDERKDFLLPHIEGPLYVSSNDNIEIIIRYPLYLGNDIPSHVFITERNSHISLGDPEVNPQLELIEIDGKSVTKTRDDWGSGYGAYFSFSSNNIYFIVETLNLPTEEAMKVVKSLIQQAGLGE